MSRLKLVEKCPCKYGNADNETAIIMFKKVVYPQ